MPGGGAQVVDAHDAVTLLGEEGPGGGQQLGRRFGRDEALQLAFDEGVPRVLVGRLGSGSVASRTAGRMAATSRSGSRRRWRSWRTATAARTWRSS